MMTNMKNKIADTFFQMVEKKGVDKVTVKDLVETCGISRQTFYYHFQDLLDVVEWSARKGVQQALDQSLAAESLEDALHAFIVAGMDNYALIEKMLKSQKHDHLEKILVDALQVYLLELFRNKAPNVPVEYETAQVALRFYACGIVGVLLDYCGRRDCNPNRLAHQINLMLQGKLIQLNTTD